MSTSICPACGLARRQTDSPTDPRYNASGECWALYCELSGYTLGRGYEPFIHQHAVDTYALQHVIDRPSNIGVAFSLIGLYLALERGFSGRDVQRAHMRLARQRKQWPLLERPARRAALTVADVMASEPGDARDAAIMRWAAAVWETWETAQPWARTICEDLLDVRAS